MFIKNIIVSAVQWILEAIGTLFANGCQLISTAIFDATDNILGVNKNIIVNTLKPVYQFCKTYLVPVGLMLMGVIVAWALLTAMFGRFSTQNDDPARIMIRACIFGLVITLTPQLIGMVGAIPAKNGNVGSGFVFQVADSLGSAGKDAGKKGSQKKAVKAARDAIEQGQQRVENFTGYTVTQEDADDSTTYTAEPIGDTDNTKWSSVLTAAGLAGMIAGHGFAVFFIELLLYVAVYGVMLLMLAWRCLKICARYVYRCVVFLVLLYMAPLALACGPTKGTSRITDSWMRMVAGYGVLTILTAAFMGMTSFVIRGAFIYGGDSLISNAFAFLVASMFLKMVYDLERYVEKAGMSAAGLPDSVSGMGMAIGMAGHSLLSAATKGGMAKATNAAQTAKTAAGFKVHDPAKSGDERVKAVFASNGGMSSPPPDGVVDGIIINESNKKTTAQDTRNHMQNRGKNDKAFVQDSNGRYMRAKDGMMHKDDEFTRDEKGNLVLKDDNSVGIEDPSERYSLSNEKVGSEGVRGLDDETGVFTGVQDAPEDMQLTPDDNGDYYIGNGADGAVAVNKNDLDPDNTQEYAMIADGTGGFSAREWNSAEDGDKYRLDKNGNLVNVGNGERYAATDNTALRDASAKMRDMATQRDAAANKVSELNAQIDAAECELEDASQALSEARENGIKKGEIGGEAVVSAQNHYDKAWSDYDRLNGERENAKAEYDRLSEEYQNAEANYNQLSDSAVTPKYIAGGGDKVFNAKTGDISSFAAYNSTLPSGARIANTGNLEWCSESKSKLNAATGVTGATEGIVKQRLVDPVTGAPTGQYQHAKITIYDNNEVNRAGDISRYMKSSASANPCEGFTADGKYYVHIEPLKDKFSA